MSDSNETTWLEDDDDDSYNDGDLGDCPYYARFYGLPGHDPGAVCYRMGLCERAEEPECVTCEPSEGWNNK